MLYLLETSGQKETTKDVMEVEIDQLLKKRDGLIQRDRDPQLTPSLSLSLFSCHHGPQGKSLNCAPLQVSVSYC